MRMGAMLSTAGSALRCSTTHRRHTCSTGVACHRYVLSEPPCNKGQLPTDVALHLERLGIALLSSRVMGEAPNAAAAGRHPDCRPSGVATSRASACGGGMRMPDSCAAASAVPTEADVRSSFRMARCAAASTAAGSTCTRGRNAVSISSTDAMRIDEDKCHLAGGGT
jgi:hypothetical protein